MAGPPISLAKVEEMFQVWCESHQVAVVARRCKVHHLTVQKYLKRGDAARGIEPFSVRSRRLVRQVQRQTERLVTYGTVEQIKETAYQISALDDLIALAVDRVRERISKEEIKFSDLTKAIMQRNQIVAMFASREKRTETATDVGALMSSLSPEELEALADDVDGGQKDGQTRALGAGQVLDVTAEGESERGEACRRKGVKDEGALAAEPEAPSPPKPSPSPTSAYIGGGPVIDEGDNQGGEPGINPGFAQTWAPVAPADPGKIDAGAEVDDEDLEP